MRVKLVYLHVATIRELMLLLIIHLFIFLLVMLASLISLSEEVLDLSEINCRIQIFELSQLFHLLQAVLH